MGVVVLPIGGVFVEAGGLSDAFGKVLSFPP
jgi:hypothetical protein